MLFFRKIFLLLSKGCWLFYSKIFTWQPHFLFHFCTLCFQSSSLMSVLWLCYRYNRGRGSQPGDLSVSWLWCDPTVPGACPQWAWLPRRPLFPYKTPSSRAASVTAWLDPNPPWAFAMSSWTSECLRSRRWWWWYGWLESLHWFCEAW